MSEGKQSLTVIIPVYNEAAILRQSVARTKKALAEENMSITLLLIDDGSSDASWQEIEAIAAEDAAVRGLRLSRNFGKEGAIAAGLDYADGDCAVIMDADMQHPPEVIPEMIARWQEGFAVVEGKKTSRGEESRFSRMAAGGFYRVLKATAGMDLQNAADFCLLDRTVVDAWKQMPERRTFFRAMSSWVGFPRTCVYFETEARIGGKTKFSKAKLFRLAVDGITAFSAAPLQLVTFSGIIMLFVFVVLGIQTLYMKLSGRAVEGFTTVLLLLLIIGGMLMLGLGIIGMYIARIYEEVKGRPRYLLQQQTREIEREG